VDGYTAEHSSGVKVLGAIASRDEDILDVATRVPEILGSIRQGCNYVIVDTPPVVNAAVAHALDTADEILLVGQPDLPSLRRLKGDIDFLHSHQLGDKMRVVLNNVSPESGLKPADLEKTLGISFDAVISSDAKTVQAAANKGIPFCITNKASRVAQDIHKLAEKMAGKEEETERKMPESKRHVQTGRRSLFGKIRF
jgi:pilus assembly protein CpaE